MKEIGGYIELELKCKKKYLHSDLIKINSGRNGIKYAIRAYKIKTLWVPFYTCPVVYQACYEENCDLKFYSIDKNFLPIEKFHTDDFILYTNYFGVCAKNIDLLYKKYPNLIIDNAQAFYMFPTGIASAYSPRKFFGCSDGGYVFCQKKLDANFGKDYSFERFSHLIKRADVDSNFGYKDFMKNDDSLIGTDILEMSNLTEKILSSVDYTTAKKRRLKNFGYLKNELDKYNELKIDVTEKDVPMYYPFLLKNDVMREKFLHDKIYIPMCWKNMEKTCLPNSYELYLQKYLFPLIVDQRYNLNDMKRIVSVILYIVGG